MQAVATEGGRKFLNVSMYCICIAVCVFSSLYMYVMDSFISVEIFVKKCNVTFSSRLSISKVE